MEPMRKHRSAEAKHPGVRIPMPGPSQTERLSPLHGHDSLHDVKEAEVREQRSDPNDQIPDHCPISDL